MFVSMYDNACASEGEYFPLVLALEALMLLYTSTHSKSIFEEKYHTFKWIDSVHALKLLARCLRIMLQL